MGYVIIKHLDVSEVLKDYEVLDTERLQVGDGEHIFHPKEFAGYESVLYPEPPIINPDICDDEWELPEVGPIPFGSQRLTIDPEKGFGYVEFYYEKVKK